MFLWLSHTLAPSFHFFRVFQYLSFRCIAAAISALLFSLWLCPRVIRYFQQRQIGQAIREDGPKRHLKKSGTPTMGGIVMLVSIVVSLLLWADWRNTYVLLASFVLIAFGVVGGVDDYRKVIQQNSKGLSARSKFFWQSVIALGVAGYLYHIASAPVDTQLFIPFMKSYTVELGAGFIVLAFFVIVGSSNAVNLTDGLDGLALMPIVLVCIALAVFCYFSGNVVFSNYLLIPYVRHLGELTVLCSAVAGAGLGFLWFNTYPAQIFMGDVGSLSLGATIGAIAVMAKQELVLLLIGGVFVAETLSVILQVASYKLTGKRIFRMAPLHHHFELLGWSEPKIIVRFWLVTVVLILLGLATLKLR